MRITVERIVDDEAPCIVALCFVAGYGGKFARTSAAHFLSAASLLGDGADLIFVDEQIRLALAREPDHAVVEVLDPAGDGLTIMQFDGYANLLFAEEAQIERFLAGITRRRRFLAPAGGVKGRHMDIVADGWRQIWVASTARKMVSPSGMFYCSSLVPAETGGTRRTLNPMGAGWKPASRRKRASQCSWMGRPLMVETSRPPRWLLSS